MENLIRNMDECKALADKLSKSLTVNANVSSIEEDPASTMAHAFMDLEDSFRKYLNELLPKLLCEDLNEMCKWQVKNVPLRK